MSEESNKQGFWARFWHRPGKWWLLGIPLGGYIAALLGMGVMTGFHVSVEATGTNEFCAGACHSMEAFTVPEYKESIHYSNASGVRADCADCHIPREWGPKLVRKATAGARDVYGEITGVIDTKEKYEAHKYAMAEAVWESMRANDSRECRNCHQRDAMALEMQGRRARRMHSPEYVAETGKTCIDCHTGVAHEEPTPPLPDLGGDDGATGP